MTVEEFWNNAFLAALTRCSATDAYIEASKATKLAIDYWEEHGNDKVHAVAIVQKMDITTAKKYWRSSS